MPSTTVNRGNVLYTIVMQVPLTPVATAASTSAEQSFTIPGLLSTDQISACSFLGANAVLIDAVNTRVSAANTLGITFQNNTAGGLTFPAGNWYIEVNRLEAPSNVPSNAS
jgi:hypothetical protein